MRDYLNMFGKAGRFGIIIGILAVVAAGIGIMFDNPIIGIIVIVAGVGLEFAIFRIFLGPNVKQRRLLATGEEATAKILEISDTGVTVNMNPMVKFLLEVQPKDGKSFQAHVKTIISRLDVPQFQPGTVVPVVFNPKNRAEVAIGTKEDMGSGSGDAAGAERAATGAVVPGDAGAGAMSKEQIEALKAKLQAADKVSEEIIATGEEAPAKITLANWMGVHVNGNNPLMHFMLEVIPPGKPPFMAEVSGVIAEASLPRYQPGETIAVKFDPKDQTRVALFHS